VIVLHGSSELRLGKRTRSTVFVAFPPSNPLESRRLSSPSTSNVNHGSIISVDLFKNVCQFFSETISKPAIEANLWYS
jgi:hypothetical protein